jgi:hypothetical protein
MSEDSIAAENKEKRQQREIKKVMEKEVDKTKDEIKKPFSSSSHVS